MDNVIIFSKDFENHVERLAEVCQCFHFISQHGVATNPGKVEAEKEWQFSCCTQEVKSFLGFVGYYWRFCPNCATVVRPLNVLSSKETTIHWGAEVEGAF